ncbi:MAG: ABC transporter ATP-binding protein [Candidatus Rokuibacteriota bacterium]|nr:MAG: ABC transporter ATP-binding protein [Candidatus Rokubacteria bacterium]
MATYDSVIRTVPLLEVRDLHRSFYGIRALDGVDLVVQPGTITGLIGPNGAGKTTLFNCVSGLIPPQRGRIVFDGRDVTGWRADRVTQAGLVRTGARRREHALRERAFAIARRLNLARVVNDAAADLSGGQKKLLELGRALMTEPKLILLDEPIAGVNPTLARELADHLRTLQADGLTFLIIEHHLDLIARLCRPVVVMAEGRHLAEGSFAEVAADPRVQEAYMGRRRWAS